MEKQKPEGASNEWECLPDKNLEQVASSYMYNREKENRSFSIGGFPKGPEELISVKLLRRLPGDWKRSVSMVQRILIKTGVGRIHRLYMAHTLYMDLRERAIDERWPRKLREWLATQGLHYNIGSMLLGDTKKGSTTFYCNGDELSKISEIATGWRIDQGVVGTIVVIQAISMSTSTQSIPLAERKACKKAIKNLEKTLVKWEQNLLEGLKERQPPQIQD